MPRRTRQRQTHRWQRSYTLCTVKQLSKRATSARNKVKVLSKILLRTSMPSQRHGSNGRRFLVVLFLSSLTFFLWLNHVRFTALSARWPEVATA
jgi:hypothetical protein